MRWWPALACVVVLIPAAGADVGHLPTTSDLYIHFAGEDRLPMQTMVPTRFVLPDAPAAPACGSALTWTAVFTQIPVGETVTWTRGLGAVPDFHTSPPQLTWFIETVAPGSGDPLAAPLVPMRLHAELRTGDDQGAASQGRLLAQGTTDQAPSSVATGERFVHRYTMSLAWTNRTVAPQEGLHLSITLDAGLDECRSVPPGVRAYADRAHQPHLRVKVYDPVKIERLEAVRGGDAWTIVWHASSPWGRFDLADPEPPQVRGPGGPAATPTLVAVSDGPRLETLWAWPGGPNGTYRVDAMIENRDNSSMAMANAVFQVGSPDVAMPQTDPPAGHSSPGAAAWLALGAALLVRRRS